MGKQLGMRLERPKMLRGALKKCGLPVALAGLLISAAASVGTALTAYTANNTHQRRSKMAELLCLKCGKKCTIAKCPNCDSREFMLIKALPDPPTLADQRGNGLPWHEPQPDFLVERGRGFAR